MPHRWLFCGIATLVPTAAGSAQQDTARAKLVTGQDPTQVITQFQPYVAISALPQNVTRYDIFVPSGVLALTKHLYLSTQIPYVVQTAGSVPGAQTENAVGDLEVFPVVTTELRKGFRVLVGVNMTVKIATATLGNGAWLAAPGGGVSIGVVRHLQFVTVVSYQFSFDEDPGVSPTSNLVTSEFIIYQMPKAFYGILQLNPVYSFEDDKLSNLATLQMGKFFDLHRTVGPFVQFNVNTGQKTNVYPYSSQVQFGLTWLLPREKIPFPH